MRIGAVALRACAITSSVLTPMEPVEPSTVTRRASTGDKVRHLQTDGGGGKRVHGMAPNSGSRPKTKTNAASATRRAKSGIDAVEHAAMTGDQSAAVLGAGNRRLTQDSNRSPRCATTASPAPNKAAAPAWPPINGDERPLPHGRRNDSADRSGPCLVRRQLRRQLGPADQIADDQRARVRRPDDDEQAPMMPRTVRREARAAPERQHGHAQIENAARLPQRMAPPDGLNASASSAPQSRTSYDREPVRPQNEGDPASTSSAACRCESRSFERRARPRLDHAVPFARRGEAERPQPRGSRDKAYRR